MAQKAKTQCARPRRAKAVSRSKKKSQKTRLIEDLAVESSWKSDPRDLGKAQAGAGRAGAKKARKRRASSAEADAQAGPFGLDDPCVEEVKTKAGVKAKRKGRKRKRVKRCAPNEGEEGKFEEDLEGANWTEGGDNQNWQGDDTAAWL